MQMHRFVEGEVVQCFMSQGAPMPVFIHISIYKLKNIFSGMQQGWHNYSFLLANQ